MPTVSNTSPILNFAIIGQLDLLKAQFTKILIPPAVLQELRLEDDFPELTHIQKAIKAGWLQVMPLENLQLAQILKLDLDAGEAEAIALALQIKVQRILLDERDGRHNAISLGLTVTGVLGVLLRAKRQEAIPSIKSSLLALRQQAGFFIAEDLFNAILVEADE